MSSRNLNKKWSKQGNLLKAKDIDQKSEEINCSFFGCKRKLSVTDQLYNNKCIKHQDIEIETIF